MHASTPAFPTLRSERDIFGGLRIRAQVSSSPLPDLPILFVTLAHPMLVACGGHRAVAAG